MTKNLSILFAALVVILLPFALRPTTRQAAADPDALNLVIVSSHNEAIRYEFARAFSAWHREHYGKAVRVDWRSIGGTSEISRYLAAEFVSAARAWWKQGGHPWPAGADEVLLNRRFDTKNPPVLTRRTDEAEPAFAARQQAETERWKILRDLWLAFRSTDDPSAFGSRIDLFFGGGEYDHSRAYGQGLTVPPWPEGRAPAGLFQTASGVPLIPEQIGGEIWRTPTLFGNAVSTFGICYSLDRLQDLGLASRPPRRWQDLADPVYFRQLGLADPTKSGSIAKAFELIVHEQCAEAVRAAGYDEAATDALEKGLASSPPVPVPPAYQSAVEAGWVAGLRLLQRLGANARYFTDSASKVPVDVAMGNAAAGLAIDFYARFEAQSARSPEGVERMVYITPEGGSGASCDPIGLLRGAPNREVAIRFIEFVLGTEGQRLWTYRPGTPGGPEKYALRRVPIRRDFFPSDDPEIQRIHAQHALFAADRLADPLVNPYELARHFTYRARWTGQHFGILRDIVRAMCIDSAQELQAAWVAIQAQGDPARKARALALLERLPDRPEPLTWTSALVVGRRHERLDYLRDWTSFFRASYSEAQRAAEAP